MAVQNRAEFDKESNARRSAALKAAGVPEEGFKERIDQLTTQAKDARENRDQDRWLSLAQGFFAMGAGKSPYALQNMSEGLGVTTKQLKEVEGDFQKAEKTRLDAIAALKQSQRAEVLGNETRRDAEYDKHLALVEKSKEHIEAGNTRLLTIMDNKETRRQTLAGQQATAGARLAEVKAFREDALEQKREEGKRRDEKSKRDLYEKATEKHPSYKSLQALDQAISDAQGVPNLSTDKQRELQKQIDSRNSIAKRISADARRTAMSEFSSGDVFNLADSILAKKGP
jgi:hypothetical protein